MTTTRKSQIAGLRCTRKGARGQAVGVYDGIAAEMDTYSGRWQSVCEEHGQVISHETQSLAWSAAAEPEDWCDECRSMAEMEK